MLTREQWIFEQHSLTNHFYDTYLPYEFHLRMVDTVANRFKHLLDDHIDYFTGKEKYRFTGKEEEFVTLRTACLIAAKGHDLIEDTRVSYNDVKNHLGQEAADIIYACSNEKGKNRKERANDKYYQGIRKTPGAVFVKLCDRIANVQYSKMTGSRMFEMYKNENKNFLEKLGYTETSELNPLFNELLSLFN
jgi:(p)ppGpp synthase/HD superfamily hydrolase